MYIYILKTILSHELNTAQVVLSNSQVCSSTVRVHVSMLTQQSSIYPMVRIVFSRVDRLVSTGSLKQLSKEYDSARNMWQGR